MPLIFITGISGSGKSTVLAELSRHGYEAHGVDEEGFADWVDRKTGNIIPFPKDESSVDIHEWYEKHNWVLSEERIAILKAQSDKSPKPVFLAGLADGDDKVWHLFDKVIYLAIDEAALKHRIETRKDNSFGKTPGEMKAILKWLRENDARYRSNGAIVVDATKPVDRVVDEVIQRTESSPKLIILSGLPFSDKTTLAQKLHDALGLRVVSYDNDIYAKHKDEVPPDTSPAKEYEIVQAIAREHLRSLLTRGESIIYDDLNLEKTDRQLIVELARQCNAKLYIIFVDTPLSVIEERRQANMQSPNRGHIDQEKMKLNISLLQKPSNEEGAIYFKPEDSLEELVRIVQ